MLTMLRHAAAIMLMPFMVVAGVPWLLMKTFAGVDHRWSGPLLELPFRTAGSLLFVVGLALFSWCVGLFARIGHGTLAPWDPARDLVTVGPYRIVRNHMISGVAMMLLGQTLFEGSAVLGIWACTFLCINHFYFVLSEEPGLERRFGESYGRYKESVPRWVPCLKLWSGRRCGSRG